MRFDTWSVLIMLSLCVVVGLNVLAFAVRRRPIKAKRLTDKALQESESRYRNLYENGLDIVYTHDMQGYFTSINKAGEHITGYTLDGKTRLGIAQIMAPDQLDHARQMIEQKITDPSPTTYELDIVARDGRLVTLEVNSKLVYQDGSPVGVQGIARDVTEARANTKHLAQMVSQLGTVLQTALQLNSSHDSTSLLCQTLSGIIKLIAPDEAKILILNDTGRMFALRAEVDSAGQAVVKPIRVTPCPATRAIMAKGEACFVEEVEVAGVRSSLLSETVKAYAALPLHTPDRVSGLLLVSYNHPFRFPPDLRQLIQIMTSHTAVALANSTMVGELKRAATTDPLTGLPNHRHLMDRLDEEMVRARRGGHPLTVMMLDVDGFKLINDTHGHTVGDELLRRIARTVRSALRSTDILGRYGGDEFLALLPETGRDSVDKLVKRVLSAVESQAFRVPMKTRTQSTLASPEEAGNDGQSGRDLYLPLCVSLGIATFPIDSATRLELISLADAAMYVSKRAGGNTATKAHDTNSGFMAAQNNTFGVLEALVNAVDGKDHYTRAHSEHVAKFALRLSDSLGMQADTKRMIRVAALLHDVGKIGIPDHILRKPGPLDADEREIVRQHPLLSEMIMRETPQLTDMLDGVRHHHERWDGQGYPRGLKGDDVPIIARLLAIADAYSAMVTDRPYRKALPLQEAIQELRRGAGSQFDPSMIEPFIEVVLTASICDTPVRAFPATIV
ncbi:MAG: diguanylate cyclase [Dehalococcoidia bacterium]|nr:diguanylate cyclase [Dehalococcoidia bacterium]